MKEKVEILMNSLLYLPKEIMSLQLTALSLNDDIQKVSDEITCRENEIKSEINAAVDDAGKKLYSNEESRKIAFLSDSKSDSTLVSLYDTKGKLDATLQTTKVEIEMKSNVQRNIRSIMGVIASSAIEA
jgi:hypothetical protein